MSDRPEAPNLLAEWIEMTRSLIARADIDCSREELNSYFALCDEIMPGVDLLRPAGCLVCKGPEDCYLGERVAVDNLALAAQGVGQPRARRFGSGWTVWGKATTAEGERLLILIPNR